MDDISPIKGHFEFIQMLINAKAVADMDNKEIIINWRGVQHEVRPNQEPFSKKEIRRRLQSVLDKIYDGTPEEIEFYYNNARGIKKLLSSSTLLT